MALHRSREAETLTWVTYDWVHSGEQLNDPEVLYALVLIIVKYAK